MALDDAGWQATDILVDGVVAVDKACPTFVGVCDRGSNPGLLSHLFNEICEDLRIFAGGEPHSLPMLAAGASGLMNAAGNLCPRPYADLCEAVGAGDLVAARDFYHSLCDIHDAVNADVVPVTIKYMMKRLGILPGNDHRLPLAPASPALEKRLDGVLRLSGMIG